MSYWRERYTTIQRTKCKLLFDVTAYTACMCVGKGRSIRAPKYEIELVQLVNGAV